jgi:hypothetical protein
MNIEYMKTTIWKNRTHLAQSGAVFAKIPHVKVFELAAIFLFFISPFMSLTGFSLGMNIFHFEAIPLSA